MMTVPTILLTLALGAAPAQPVWTVGGDDAAAAARQKASELAAQAESAEAVRQPQLHLDAASTLLGAALAPIASRTFLEIPAAGDAQAARDLLAEASRHLDAVPKTDGAGESAEDFGQQVEALRAFVRAGQALWGEHASEEAARQARGDAAFDLSLLMEARHAGVARTARLWRAFLFHARGDDARAFDLLPTELGPPIGDPTVSLYLSILRSRVFVKEQGSYAAAIALATRLEADLPAWFESADAAAAAARTVAFLRRGLLRDWHAALTAAGQGDRAAWCSAAIQRIDQETFANPQAAELLALPWGAPPQLAFSRTAAADADTNGPAGADDADVSTAGFERD